MRHGKKVDMLGKPADQRKALLRSLATEVIKHGQILTTETRAKAVRKEIEHLITLAKKGDLHSRRQAAAYIYGNRRGEVLYLAEGTNIDKEIYTEVERKDKKVKVYVKTPVQHLFTDIAPRYTDRNGGYVRVVKAPPRRGDAAPMAIVQLV
ncbi:MAG: 50S ribosomal protein L17 [Candidatus Sericytochromatia bacterium]|nr:50S ribosomal protein L17 [Candidatus Sericytochromatia bacterium]